MRISIWDYEKPLDAMMLSHDHMAAMVLKHEQQIKDIAAHLLELKQRVTPMMEFKPEKSLQEPVAWLHWLTVDGERFPQLTLMPRTDKDEPLYTSPKHTWVGLTDDEMKQCSYDAEGFTIGREVAMRAVEAKLKEKNGG